MNHLVVLDIETTGTDKRGNDWIIQFAAIKVDRDTNKMIDKLNLYIRPDTDNYVMSIGAYLKHNIHPDMLVDKPTFKEVAWTIHAFLEGCDILTYNGIAFDLPFLMTEFARAGIEFRPSHYVCYDAYKEELRRNSNKLSDTFKRYCGRTMDEAGLTAHDGLSDVKATYAVFRHQMENGDVKPEKMVTDDNILISGEFNGKEVVMLNIGRYRDVPLEIVKSTDRSYLTWLVSTNISKRTKEIINDVLNNE